MINEILKNLSTAYNFIKKYIGNILKGADRFSNNKKSNNFRLILTINSGKVKSTNRGNVSTSKVKELINNSRYFLLENDGDDVLKDAKTSSNLPNEDKDHLFILKIKGKATSEIRKYENKIWLRDNITSDTCEIESILHLLDAGIINDKKFIPTI